jgi:hypothetical protein
LTPQLDISVHYCDVTAETTAADDDCGHVANDSGIHMHCWAGCWQVPLFTGGQLRSVVQQQHLMNLPSGVPGCVLATDVARRVCCSRCCPSHWAPNLLHTGLKNLASASFCDMITLFSQRAS